MDKKNKKLVIIVSCLIAVIGITFAYFIAQSNKGASGKVNVGGDSLDELTFNVSKDISLSIDQFNFASGAGNLSDQATATASLKANSTKNTASYNYNVYFYISSNNYVYTTSDNKPEIVLTITDPTGAEVKSIDGLTYYDSITNADGVSISGFDITTQKGLLNVALDYAITSNSSSYATSQNWKVKITFINLATNQVDNQNKNLDAKIFIQQGVFTPTLADYVKSQFTTQGDKNLYFHDSTLENGAGDNSYRYAGSSDTTNNFVCFGTDASTCPTDNLYRIIGVFDDQVKLIKYDYAKSSLLGTDGDYINTYSGTTLSGTNKGENTKEEIGAYCWNCSNGSTSTNTWSSSRLNKTNLNTNFISNIGTTWANKIATHTWIVGGNTSANIGTEVAPTVYKNEITSPATDTKYTAKIGLMYASDYGYSASPSAWEITIDYYDDSSVTSANWMYMGLLEWMISPLTDSSVNSLYIFYNGDVGPIRVNGNDAVRPVFYLDSSVKYKSGEGTQSSPMIIE